MQQVCIIPKNLTITISRLQQTTEWRGVGLWRWRDSSHPLYSLPGSEWAGSAHCDTEKEGIPLGFNSKCCPIIQFGRTLSNKLMVWSQFGSMLCVQTLPPWSHSVEAKGFGNASLHPNNCKPALNIYKLFEDCCPLLWIISYFSISLY